MFILDKLRTSSDVTDIIGTDPMKAFLFDVPAYLLNDIGERTAVKPPYLMFQYAGGDDVRTLANRTGFAQTMWGVHACAYDGKVAYNLYMAVMRILHAAEEDLWGSMRVVESKMEHPEEQPIDPFDGSGSSLKVMSGRLYTTIEADSQTLSL